MRRFFLMIMILPFIVSCSEDEEMQEKVSYESEFEYYINIDVVSNGKPYRIDLYCDDELLVSKEFYEPFYNEFPFKCPAKLYFKNDTDWSRENLEDGELTVNLFFQVKDIGGYDDLINLPGMEFKEDSYVLFDSKVINKTNCQFKMGFIE